ncbi:MerR family transcriptional regulator [Caenimonas sp. SL110]|uniref:MerR family transcriptional regulator n=1 Tax=Caenimonas sp. SL110 TaxID=1450524 RepID=UPI00069D8426|nr:MerR family transcriptional regulator [Caenimonas sp. SL110]
MRSIAEVERDTALPRATLRIWERRYGFPAPLRDERGERTYPDDQVQKLRMVRRLMDQGHRPGKLLVDGATLLDASWAAGAEREPEPDRSGSAAQLVSLLRAHDAEALRHELETRLARLGLSRFAGEELPAMNLVIGSAWVAGEIEIHEEHLFSATVQHVVRSAIDAIETPIRPEAPTVLLTTFPQEHHGLGLLMAQAMFALQGCPTVSLGIRLPVEQIVSGAKAYKAAIVGLSFSPATSSAQVVRGLQDLRGRLGLGVKIWVGGSHPVLRKKAIPGVRFVVDAMRIGDYLADDFGLPPR